jgi:hypothetical protein
VARVVDVALEVHGAVAKRGLSLLLRLLQQRHELLRILHTGEEDAEQGRAGQADRRGRQRGRQGQVSAQVCALSLMQLP